MGAGDLEEARRSAFTGLRTAWVYSFTMVMVFLFGARALVRVFLPGLEDGGADVSTMAVTMLRMASLYIMADSAQLVFVGALRGAGDTRWVMAVSVSLHWIFAIAAVILIKVAGVHPVAAWTGFIAFIMSMGLTMFLRFRGGKWKEIRMIERAPEEQDYRYNAGACPEVLTEESIEKKDVEE